MKVFGKILAAVLCVVALMTVAFAAETTFAPTADGTYSIPYTEGAEGSYYALLVVKGVYTEGQTPEISEDTVLYIDQATADANGDVSFDGWLPKNEEPATVYLGSNQAGFEGPVLLGYLGQSKFVVSGKVATQTALGATVTLINVDDAGNTYAATTVDGVYAINNVAGGTYKIVITALGHTSYTKNALEVSADTTFKDVAIRGGDVDYTGEVNAADLNGLLANFNSSDEDCDIDGTGEVNAADLNTLLANFNAQSVVED